MCVYIVLTLIWMEFKKNIFVKKIMTPPRLFTAYFLLVFIPDLLFLKYKSKKKDRKKEIEFYSGKSTRIGFVFNRRNMTHHFSWKGHCEFELFKKNEKIRNMNITSCSLAKIKFKSLNS